MKLLTISRAPLFFVILGIVTVVHSQEPKQEAKPAQSHPGATASHSQVAPPSPAARPQATPSPHPAAPSPHEGKPPEPRPQSAPSKSPPQMPAQTTAHPTAATPHEGKPPEPRPQEHPVSHPQETGHREDASPKPQAPPPQAPHNTTAPAPSPNARPEPGARPTAAPPRTAEVRRPTPTAQQQQDWERHRVENWQAAHRSWNQRGGYRGYRVPQDRYNAYFGPPHAFRIYEYPVTFADTYPRFQYGGHWVQVLDPWPNYWAPDWFYTDPVYVEYLNDGYYLVDTRYPEVPLAVEIF